MFPRSTVGTSQTPSRSSSRRRRKRRWRPSSHVSCSVTTGWLRSRCEKHRMSFNMTSSILSAKALKATKYPVGLIDLSPYRRYIAVGNRPTGIFVTHSAFAPVRMLDVLCDAISYVLRMIIFLTKTGSGQQNITRESSTQKERDAFSRRRTIRSPLTQTRGVTT